MGELKPWTVLNICFLYSLGLKQNEYPLHKSNFPEKFVVWSQFCRKGRIIFSSRSERVPSCTNSNQQSQGPQPDGGDVVVATTQVFLETAILGHL